MLNKSKYKAIGFMIIVCFSLFFLGKSVYEIDPFFHYHKPETDKYFYSLNNERSQNDGIVRHFDYDAVLTGTSMTECFKTTELDALFGTNSVKLPFSGGSYKEINEIVEKSLALNPNMKMVVRGVDMDRFLSDKDWMRDDLGEFPTYLYDDNSWNDVKYVFNKDVIFSRIVPMVYGEERGITSFDSYADWSASFTFGMNTVASEGVSLNVPNDFQHISEEEKNMVKDNVSTNLTRLAEQYPDIDFYYFFPPYSAVWWCNCINNNLFYRQIEAEAIVVEELLKYPNIKLFSFNMLTNIITDINNYKDATHYGPWINQFILKCMKEEKCLLTKSNYKKYLKEEEEFYRNYDYQSLNQQEDYEDDSLVKKEIENIVISKLSW